MKPIRTIRLTNKLMLPIALVGLMLGASACSSDNSPNTPTQKPSVTGTTGPSTTAMPSAKPSSTQSPSPTTASPSTSPSTTSPSASASATASSAPKKNVVVFITRSDWNANDGVQLGGYVEVIDNGGTCTLTLTKGTEKYISQISSTRDASTMSCSGIYPNTKNLGAGTWDITLSYDSAESAGTSEPFMVEVQ